MGVPGGRGHGLPEQAPVHLECSLRHRIGAVSLDIAFRAHAPWTILFGPSGSGKSTVLRILAGLIRPDTGAVTMMGRIVNHAAAGVFVPAHLRPMRWDGQQSALFPRLTVRENLGLAAGAGGLGGDDLERAIGHFGLDPLATKRPHELSGGEQQRVAVVRAALTAPGRLLLLDEPFTGMDTAVRDALILQLRGWLQGSPVLSVTHDLGEALLLEAEVLRLQDGRIVAQGPAREVLAEERQRMAGLLAGDPLIAMRPR